MPVKKNMQQNIAAQNQITAEIIQNSLNKEQFGALTPGEIVAIPLTEFKKLSYEYVACLNKDTVRKIPDGHFKVWDKAILKRAEKNGKEAAQLKKEAARYDAMAKKADKNLVHLMGDIERGKVDPKTAQKHLNKADALSCNITTVHSAGQAKMVGNGVGKTKNKSQARKNAKPEKDGCCRLI